MDKKLEARFFDEFVNPFNENGLTEKEMDVFFDKNRKLYLDVTEKAIEEKSYDFFCKRIKNKWYFICLPVQYISITKILVRKL